MPSSPSSWQDCIAHLGDDDLVSLWSGPALGEHDQPTIIGVGVAAAWICRDSHRGKVETLVAPSRLAILASLLDDPGDDRDNSSVSGGHAFDALTAAWMEQVERCVMDEATRRTNEEIRLNYGINVPTALCSLGFSPSTPSILILPRRTWISIGQRWWRVDVSSTSPTDTEFNGAVVSGETVNNGEASSREERQKPGVDDHRRAITDHAPTDPVAWSTAVAHVVDELRSGAAQKVVMARDALIATATPVSVGDLAAALHDLYPTCWTFAVANLVGASPEMLASVRRGEIRSRVLAGTCAPGDGAALWESAKDREEHRLAALSVTSSLQPIVAGLDAPEQPSLLRLPNVVHLCTDIRATLDSAPATDDSHAHSSSGLARVVEALHPTAAVCGVPTEVAYSMVRDHELMDRGRYAGPVGWVDRSGEGACAIALRCGEVASDGRSVRIFAGGGIMPDSVPEREVAETEAKMRPMREAIARAGTPQPQHAGTHSRLSE